MIIKIADVALDGVRIIMLPVTCVHTIQDAVEQPWGEPLLALLQQAQVTPQYCPVGRLAWL